MGDLKIATSNLDFSSASTWQSISRLLALGAAGIAVVVLVGWLLNIPLFESLSPKFSTMKPWTAVALGLGAISILAFHSEKTFQLNLVSAFCAAATLVIGAIVLFEIALKMGSGFDTLLFHDSLTRVRNTLIPGRMASATAVGLVLTGMALLAIHKNSLLAQIFALCSLILGLLGLVGYLFGVQDLYQFRPYSTVAVHTALSFCLLSTAIIFATSEQGLMRIVSSIENGGVLIRRMLPATVVISLTLGWLRLWGEQEGLYPSNFGVLLLVFSFMLVFSILLLITGNYINHIDRQRRYANQAASHDVLTGLPNRRFIDTFLTYAISQASRNKTKLALLFLDLDGFKKINDQHGHKAGDHVLVTIASRLSSLLRTSDVFAS